MDIVMLYWLGGCVAVLFLGRLAMRRFFPPDTQ
jgi:hypothetical protein